MATRSMNYPKLQEVIGHPAGRPTRARPGYRLPAPPLFTGPDPVGYDYQLEGSEPTASPRITYTDARKPKAGR